MKRISLIILLAAITLSGMAQTIGEAFYIYRNDGQFNAFFRDEVQAIEYSYYDADSIKYEEIVTQVVITADSVYKIPLAAIDSVGFVTPETVYKPGVINMQDGLRNYIIAVEGDIITLNSSIPSNLVPNIGDKIVTIEMSDFFPIGYAGKVNAINTTSEGVVMSCECVNLEEVFESFIGYTKRTMPVESSLRRQPWDNWNWPQITIPDGVYSGAVSWQPNPYHRVLTQGMPVGWEVTFNDWAGTYSALYEMTFAPRLWVSGFIKIAHDERYFSVTVTGDYSIQDYMRGTGKLSWNPELSLNVPIPLPVCEFLQVFFEPGFFVKAELDISSDLMITQHYGSVFHYEWSSNGTIAMAPDFQIVPKEFTISGHHLTKGELAIGGFLDIGIQAFNKNIASIYGHAEIGLSVEGNVNFGITNNVSNSLLYDNLKESYSQGCWYWGSSFVAQLTPFLKYTHDLPFGRKHPLWTHGIVPIFSNVSLETVGSNSLYAEAEVRGNLMNPVNVGFALFDENGNNIGRYYAETPYQGIPSLLSYTFDGINAEHTYTVYPIVSLNGVEMLASPSSDAHIDKFPVTLSDFKVTNSQYKENGFIYDGVAYDYRFDVSVTATLDEDAEGIADWGYVYLDPKGNEAFISLKQFGYSYTDTRYAYFRNENPSTCTLYGYVKYVGSNEAVYGEPHDYPLEYKSSETFCPDSNHPHWIDLGLPSGTQWRCCNEGASAPEADGGYYTFGQVSSAPTIDQIQELLGYCSSEWTTLNGVNGRKFTGPNGGTIFLRAAGRRDGESYYWHGSRGDYWSSNWSSTPYGDYYAYELYFNSEGVSWNALCSYGWEQSVRPVR